ncbi:MAG: alkaline phosphatase D family protein [Rubrivivax sp.]|nr:alkaline phosphatase D family protein [Rubrivivax sp.]
MSDSSSRFGDVSRRGFIRGLSAAALATPVVAREAQAHGLPALGNELFTHGVASGDPLQRRVMLWTRIAPRRLLPRLPVRWEVAHDPGFRRLAAHGIAFASAERDWTVKVDAGDLPPGTELFYRFSALGRHSPTGRTRTLPTGLVRDVRLAVFSCSNYPAGYFHAYREAARLDDLDAAVHLGDYIYEYPRGGYASDDAAALGREVEPAGELLLLQDYRARYAQYRSDPDLQALHARVPFICVWDDHEIANDTWREGAENHQAGEGSFAERRAAALRAYHEWMPTRLPDPHRPERLYRSFQFGRLVDLHMLDTRVIGRDLQLDYRNYLGATGLDAARFAADVSAPGRQLLGAEQAQWLDRALTHGQGQWTILGQQVLMGRMNVPAPLIFGQLGFSAYAALVAKAQTAPATLTPQELALLQQPAIPYNLDAWDGYAAAREALLGKARSLNKNLVVLAGDTHNAWASNLLDAQGNAVGVEFATPGVSSPGLEAVFPNENPVAFAAGLQQIIGPLVYAETQNRGFMLVTATPTECRAVWRFVDTVKSTTYRAYSGRSLRVLPGAGQRTLIEV